jgi:hypothetical protein
MNTYGNQIRPEVATLLAEYWGKVNSPERVRSGEARYNPCWYWLDYNAEHGASKEVISWLLRAAELYDWELEQK